MGVFCECLVYFVEAVAAYVLWGVLGVGVCFDVLTCVVVVAYVCCVGFCGCVVLWWLCFCLVLCPNRLCVPCQSQPFPLRPTSQKESL